VVVWDIISVRDGRVEGILGQPTFFKSSPNILGLAKPELCFAKPLCL
jgi:hypothetical protein